MGTLTALFTLKPHGNYLCGEKAKMWLLLLRSSILLIAGCEAAAWGFIGYLMGEATNPWITALLIGGAVGCLIGGLDAAFVMVDLARIRRNLQKGDHLASSSRLRRWLSLFGRHITKAHLGAFARLGMVAVSLMITAPFLAQLLFARDIAAWRDRMNDTALAAARTELATSYEGQVEKLQAELRNLENLRSREIAGQGLSSRYGFGPVARSLTLHISSVQRRIRALERDAAENLVLFDSADPETLARRYGVNLVSDGIVARWEALREMEKIPGFRWTENAFRLLLGGFFLGLVIFKWYEPRALEIYFDEELQAAYEDFRAGRYDHLLADQKIVAPTEVSPFWFERWYYGSAKLREEWQRLKDKLAIITSRQSNFEAAAANLAGEPGSEMQALQSRRAEIIEQLRPLRAGLQKESEEADRIAAEIARCESELGNADATIQALPSIQDATYIIAKKDAWLERQRAAKVLQRQHAPVVAEAQRLYGSKETELNDLDATIAAMGRVLAELTNSIVDARIKAVHELSAAHQG